ncbi:MAG: rhomboid family intramembrane serine protease [Omnitrophica bacterium]|nr:rhomboid family intramembrane serine protease [Candidatus Omnitrophota bacterium]
MQERYQRLNFGSSMSSTVKVLIIINVVVFIIINLSRTFPWADIFGMVPVFIVKKFWLWQFFTYMFLHYGLWHLVLNMLMLYFFGPAIEQAWGRKEFLTYYFFTGIGASLCSFLISPGSLTPTIGASGAIFGILVAYAAMFPDSVILLFLIFPMKMKYAIFVLAGINLLGAISNPGSGIAYFAHLGGGLFGYLYLKNEWLKFKLLNFSLANFKQKSKIRPSQRKKPQDKSLDKKVDAILDKISRQGVGSLTSQERKILEQKGRMK